MTESAGLSPRNTGDGAASAISRDHGVTREETMRQTLNRVSWTAALAAAFLTAVIGSWQEISVPALAVRCLVVGLVILAFMRGVGELAWRAVLRSLAEYQVRQEDERRERRKRTTKEQKARREDTTDSTWEPPRAEQGQEARFTKEEQTKEAGSKEKASMDRMAA